MNKREDRIPDNEAPTPTDFIRVMVADDLRTNKYGGRVATRFPPEPNGYLHIGHAKSICLNFGVALENEGGTCNLRFDDTNPETEDMKYVESIQNDIRWLGFDWEDRLFFASDYFEQLYQFAVKLIKDGTAYVDSSSEEEIREYRGTVTTPGKNSPYRERMVEENLDLFQKMRDGEFENGAHVLRAKIDMASSNMQMRDPVLYRIRHATHYRTGDDWCIYPMYDFTHCLSDAIERITHSLCSLEFKDNRELYDWIVNAVGFDNPPEQTEFARLNLDYTVVSKRKLGPLVREGHVNGWDDPRMSTIAGLRRRGVTPEAIRAFCDMIGLAKVDSRVDIEKLEHSIRDDLNLRVPRVLCVTQPLKVVIDNYPEGQTEELDASYYPVDVPKEGSRKVPFSRVLYIERDDFLEDPPKKFFRLAPGREVRLRYAYLIKCVDVIKDPTTGEVTELHCTYDPESKGGKSPDGRKVRGTIHWVNAEKSLPVEVRLYDRLFTKPDPEDVAAGEDFSANLNRDSVVVLPNSRIEPSVKDDKPGSRYQFERVGYFCSDLVDSSPDKLVFNRTVGLRDSWAKIEAKRFTTAGTEKPADEHSREANERSARRAPTGMRSPTPRELSPEAKRYAEKHGLAAGEAEVLAAEPPLASVFDSALLVCDNPKAVASWVINDLRRETKKRSLEDLPFDGRQLGSLVALVEDGTINRAIGREVLAEMVKNGGDPKAIVKGKGLEQVVDPGALEPIVENIIAENAEKVAEYRNGRLGLLGFFVGQVMRASAGKANPALVKELVQKKLS